MPPFRFNVDSLVGAEETDVDTGDKVNSGRSLDLSVVSAYLKSSLLETPQPLSAPPEAFEPTQLPAVPADDSFKGSTNVFSAVGGFSLSGTHVPSADLSGAPSLSNISTSHADSCSLICATIEEVDKLEEEDLEFYI